MNLDSFKSLYNIHEKYGFLPYPQPLETLDMTPFKENWERLVKEIAKVTRSSLQRELIREIEEMPVLDCSSLMEEGQRSMERAFVVLSFLAHFYVWGEFPECVRDRLPECLAKPWITVSEYLDLKPVLCHAGVVLWNWKLRSPSSQDPSDLDNLQIIDTASSTPDEGWFYLVTTAIEGAGGHLPWLLYQAKRHHMEADVITEENLWYLASVLDAMKKSLVTINGLMKRMYEKNDPQVFYEKVRPFLTGWENTPYLPNGLIYGSESEARMYAGGSAAQSSLIQLLDVFLGVKHEFSKLSSSIDRLAATSNTSSFENIVEKLEQLETSAVTSIPASAAKLKQLRQVAWDPIPVPEKNVPPRQLSGATQTSFQQKMRSHMPGPHRRFLEDLSKGIDMKSFINASSNHRISSELQETTAFQDLKQKFCDCVDELRLFRDKHIQMVSVYILVQSKKSVRGTGGTSIIPFLKQSRDETKQLLTL